METIEAMFALMSEPQTEEEGKAALEWLFNEMRQHESKMQQNRPEIERLKAETRRIGMRTDTTLASLKQQIEQLQAPML